MIRIGGESILQPKWWMLLVGVIVAVVCVIGVGAYFFLGDSFEGVHFEPPVDTSGVNPSPNLIPDDLLPSPGNRPAGRSADLREARPSGVDL